MQGVLCTAVSTKTLVHYDPQYVSEFRLTTVEIYSK